MNEKYWSNLEKSFKINNTYNHLILLEPLNIIKSTILNMVYNDSKLKTEIYENIDITLFKQMIENKAFNMNIVFNLIKYIIYIIKKFIKKLSIKEYINNIENWEKRLDNKIKHINILDFNYMLIEIIKKLAYYLELIVVTI